MAKLNLIHRRFHPKQHFARGYSFGAAILDTALLCSFFLLMHLPLLRQPAQRINLNDAPFTDGVLLANNTTLTILANLDLFINGERIQSEKLIEKLSHLSPAAQSPLLIEADESVPNGVLIELYSQLRDAEITDVFLATRTPALSRQ